MKRKIKGAALILIALLCVGVLAFAWTKSKDYKAPNKPAVTQQTLQKKLASSQTSPSKPADAALSKSGPEHVFALFMVSVLIGYSFNVLTIKQKDI